MTSRAIGKNPSSIRRLLTLDGTNPELQTIVATANALDADVCIIPRGKGGPAGALHHRGVGQAR
jgi:hypothetical protein